MWDDIVEEEPAKPAPAPKVEDSPPSGEGEPAPAEGEVKPQEADTPLPESPTNLEPRRLVFKHWIRPRTSQYNYIYDYQKNYYDDLITYLDRRNRGLPVEMPRAQTWGERALRTYLSNTPVTYMSKSHNQDQALLRHISTAARFQRSHTKSLISRKYSHLRISTSGL